MNRLGVVMDPIADIKTYKDSTFAMLLAAQSRSWELWYMEPESLYLKDAQVWGAMRPLRVHDQMDDWFEWGDLIETPLTFLDIILMRKDPPVDVEFFYLTFLLEVAEKQGVRVINRPQSLRDINEKLFTVWFPECVVPTTVTRDRRRLQSFLNEYEDIILKPLNSMGGQSIFRLRVGDPNTNVILETITDWDRRTVMGQRYIPEVVNGDKRILLINGEPVPYALNRIPLAGETRANLAAGGRGEGVPLTERDQWLVSRVGPTLRQRGVLFAGLDVIGDWLTEINVTSPTGIRELDSQFGLDIAGDFMNVIDRLS